MKETMAMRAPLLERLEELLDRGGTKKDVALLAVSAVALGFSFFAPETLPFNPAWIAIVLCGAPIILGAVIGLVTEFDIKADVLVSLALIAAVAIGEDFAAGEVALIMQLGALLEDLTVAKARAGIERLVHLSPRTARIVRDGVETVVAAEDVQVGDVLRVLPGETVAVDGTVLEGRTSIDESVMTGESLPVDKAPGDEVKSGTVNQFGAFDMRAQRVGEDSSLARMIELVQSADAGKAKIVRLADRWATWIVVIALTAAAGTWLVTGEIIRAVTILVVFCPCALVLATPTAIMAAIGNVTKLGVLVREGDALERLAKVRKVAFDKTGTLTDGSFNVVAIHPQAGIDPDRLLSIAAHAEAYSNHPIALSVKQAYSGPIDQQRIDDVQEQSGHGVRAKIDEHVVLVGNDKLMSECGVGCHECELTGTILHVSLDGEYIGHIVIADVVKPDAAEAVAALRAAGVKKTVMLTGDRADVAAAVAKELGIDEFRAQLLPQDKVAEVEKLLEETHAHGSGKGKLAFVGDGINDAPVLTRADIGIAMGAMGSDAAIEAADVVLMDDKPSNIARAIGIARKTMGIVWQNIVFALGIKFLVLVLAAVGIANMWLAVFADVGVAVIAILNAMRAMNVKK